MSQGARYIGTYNNGMSVIKIDEDSDKGCVYIYNILCAGQKNIFAEVAELADAIA